MYSNFLVCLLLLLSALIFLWTNDMTPGAELFPRIMAVGLALFGIIELILSYMRMGWVEKKTINATEKSLIRRSAFYMGAFFIIVLGFFIAFPLVGFEIAAVAFMLAAMMLLGGKPALRKWPIAILVPTLLILVFRIGLSVRLPSIIF
jgi:hypothetical protein